MRLIAHYCELLTILTVPRVDGIPARRRRLTYDATADSCADVALKVPSLLTP